MKVDVDLDALHSMPPTRRGAMWEPIPSSSAQCAVNEARSARTIGSAIPRWRSAPTSGASRPQPAAALAFVGPRVHHEAAGPAPHMYDEGFLAGQAIERHHRSAQDMRSYTGTDEIQAETIAKAQASG